MSWQKQNLAKYRRTFTGNGGIVGGILEFYWEGISIVIK